MNRDSSEIHRLNMISLLDVVLGVAEGTFEKVIAHSLRHSAMNEYRRDEMGTGICRP